MQYNRLTAKGVPYVVRGNSRDGRQTVTRLFLFSCYSVSIPGVNTLFTSELRKNDERQKWLNFAAEFQYCEGVYVLSPKIFTQHGLKSVVSGRWDSFQTRPRYL